MTDTATFIAFAGNLVCTACRSHASVEYDWVRRKVLISCYGRCELADHVYEVDFPLVTAARVAE